MKISIFYDLRLDIAKKNGERTMIAKKYVLDCHLCVLVCQAYNEIIDYELTIIKRTIHTHNMNSKHSWTLTFFHRKNIFVKGFKWHFSIKVLSISMSAWKSFKMLNFNNLRTRFNHDSETMARLQHLNAEPQWKRLKFKWENFQF